MVISYSETINCSPEKLWGVLLEKAQHPERTIKEISQSKILQKYSDGFLREMTAVGMVIKERITVDENSHEIKFSLVDNEAFDGYFLNKMETKDNGLILTYLQDWRPKNNSKKDFDSQFYPVLKNAVIAMKNMTESKPEQQLSRKNEKI